MSMYFPEEEKAARDGFEQGQKAGFIEHFKRFQKLMYRNSQRKGFHDSDLAYMLHNDTRGMLDAQRLMLIVSELSEALEALRHGNPADSHIPDYTGMEAELADAVIRIMDLAEANQLRLAEAIVAKAAYNSGRPHKHGGKAF